MLEKVNIIQSTANEDGIYVHVLSILSLVINCI